jgi:hypothetical protein
MFTPSLPINSEQQSYCTPFKGHWNPNTPKT